MHRKTIASELCENANSSTQHADNKNITGFSAVIPKVQMLSGKERPRSANPPRRHFLKGSHRKAPQKHHNSLNNFQLHEHPKHLSAFRCSEKQEHLNSAKMQIQAPNTLTTNVLQEFSVNTQGSDAQWEGNTHECKSAPYALPERVSPNGTTKRLMHLNLNQNRKKTPQLTE